MGYQTIVGVSTDELSMFKQTPEELVDTIAYNINAGTTQPVHGVTVVKAEHADTFQLVMSHNGHTMPMSEFSPATAQFAAADPEQMLLYIGMAQDRLNTLSGFIETIKEQR